MRSPRILAALAVMPVLALSACSFTATGGGWYGGGNVNNARMNFGLWANCEGGYGKASATYLDRATKINGTQVSFRINKYIDCTDQPGSVQEITGTYYPRPSGTPGTFHITLDDSGAIGPSKGDHLDVDLNGGRFNGYSFSHNLSGGNLKVVDTTDLHRR